MNRLMLMAAILLSGHVIASAQQPDQKPSPPVASVEDQSQNPTSRAKHGLLTLELSAKSADATLQDPATMRLPLVHTEPSFVWTNGALYSVMGSGLRIPVPGGGASGCFSEGLPERIEKVEKFVVTFTEGKQTH